MKTFRIRSILLLFLLSGIIAEVIPEEKNTKSVFNGRDKASSLVNKWFAEGKAAGNIGDRYDNRDRGHSGIPMAQFKQLKKTEYTEQQLKRRYDWGAAQRILFDVTVGNSSTSAHPGTHGSNPRLYYVNPSGISFLYLQYTNSNLFVYPEHRDYDPGRGQGGYGDLYPVNTPYLVISQGSSGSDRAFLMAFLKTLAAFHSEVKRRLVLTRLLMPTVQMIFRSSNKQVSSPDDYLTGKAHPTVFNGRNIDSVAMVKKAHDITLDNIPPMVQIKVVKEDLPEEGVHYFDPGKSEKLADTPGVIGRIFRGYSYTRKMVVDASGSYDINGKPLEFHWKLLRGNTEKVDISTTEDGRQAEITVAYHQRFRESKDSQMQTNRVDIGVFVHNGTYYSAPAFITFFFLDNELRTYGSDGRIVDIYYNAGDTTIGYAGANAQDLVGGRYAICNWDALFDTILNTEEAFASGLLKKHFTPEAIEIIRKTAEAFKSCSIEREKLRKDPIHNEYKEIRATVSKRNKELKKVRAEHKLSQTSKTESALEKAQAGYDKAVKQEKAARKSLEKIKKELRKVSEKAGRILTEAKEDSGVSVKHYVEDALNNLKNDINLYIKNASEIDKMAEACADEKRKNRYTDFKKKILSSGVIVCKKKDTYTIHSIRSGDDPLAQRLTLYERYRIQVFNLGIMNNVLFPGFLKREESKNLVDFRITTPKPWHDVYKYDPKGNITGWYRHIDGKVSEYTKDGLLVEEKDKDGKVIKTRKPEYKLDVPEKKRPWKKKIIIKAKPELNKKS